MKWKSTYHRLLSGNSYRYLLAYTTSSSIKWATLKQLIYEANEEIKFVKIILTGYSHN